MNAKQAKRLRGVIRRITGQSPSNREQTRYSTTLVASEKYSVTINGKDGPSRHDNMAMLVKVAPGVPRQLYQELKQNVQADRRT